ncbi:MAG: TIGR01777 family oxidoreductase [Thermodesulfobacteriota bacterium]|jgi:uncharacterized protein (TIGR01777 family)
MKTQDIKRAVVAGGGGFIGKPLCRALMASGYQVTVLTRGRPRPPSVTPDGPLPAFEHWDGRTAEGWGHLADGASVIVNLAGESIGERRWTPQVKQAIIESRVMAGLAIVHAVREAKAKPETLIQSSAVGYYGDTGEEPVDESSPPGQGFLADVCLQWEESTRAVESMGVRRVVVRTGLVIGRGGGVLEKMLTPFKFFLGGAFGSGEQGFPWIHIEDEVEAMLFLVGRADASGPFNLTAPEPASNAGFCRELGRALSRPCGLSIPASALRLAMGQMAEELLLSGNRPFPKRLVEMGYVFKHPRLAGALRHILSPR